MGISFVLGRAGTGKSFSFYKKIKDRLNEVQDNKLILIVPEQFTLQAERDLIEFLGLSGIMNVEVHSFTRLAHKVFNEVGGITKVNINDQGKQMVLRKILEESYKDLVIYKKAAIQTGFVESLNKMLAELKKYDISPHDLRQKIAHSNNDLLSQKLSDIALIYEKFNSFLLEGYLDSEDYLNLLINKIEESEFIRGSEVWIDGFYSFTPQTYKIIEKLFLSAKDVNISLTIDKKEEKIRDNDVFYITNKTLEQLQLFVKKHQLDAKYVVLNPLDQKFLNKSPELSHLEKELFSYPYKSYSGEVFNINIFSSMNIYSEIEQAAAQIIALARENDFRWKEISLVCNCLDVYGPYIKRIFKEYDIPFFFDEKRSILDNPITQLVLSALEVVRKGYRYEEMFKYLKTGFSNIGQEDCELLENYCLQCGINGNEWKKQFSKGSHSYDIEFINHLRESVIKPLVQLEKEIKGKKTVLDITTALYKFLENIKVHENLEKWIEKLRRKNEFEYVNENTQIWNTIIETFDQLVEILGHHELSLIEYIKILESGFTVIELGIIPTTIDQVLVGSIQRSKSHQIRALFVLGVNDGILPSGKDHSGLLQDEEKLVLKKDGLFLGSDSQTKFYEEKLHIYAAFAKPTEYFWLSYSIADNEGKALRPSILIDRFKRIFDKISIGSDVVNSTKDQLGLVVTANSTLKYLIENLRLNLEGKIISEFWWDVYSWYCEKETWQRVKDGVVTGLFHVNQDFYINSSFAKRLYSFPIKSSVSRFEKYIQCPFSHFVKYGLRPQERKVFKVSAPNIGELFHKAMEEFTRILRTRELNWRNINRHECNLLVEEILESILPFYNDGILLSSFKYKYLITRLKRVCKRAIWTLTEQLQKGNFEFFDHEISFGMNEKYPPILIELSEGEQVFIEGRIDRLDILEEEKDLYVKIIDYKTGIKDFELSDVFYGLQLQLMVYLDAVLTNMQNGWKGKTVNPAGIFYFKIEDPLIKTDESMVEIIETEIRKKLKMKGLVLNDVRIIREMDTKLDGFSEVLPVGLTKNDRIDSRSSTLDTTAFNKLIKHVRSLLQDIAQEIINGNVTIAPYQKERISACRFCQYGSVCQFDSMLKDNKYRIIKSLKDAEVLTKIPD